MPSGPTRLIYNTRERLISTDANRAQAFEAQALQETTRANYGRGDLNWLLYPGVTSPETTIAAPLYATVLDGLFVRPDAAAYLTIDAGLAVIVDTSGGGSPPGADDSAYLYCKDPGITSPAVLTFVANAVGASVRWDVVECQAVDTVLESSNRDVYNPATGLFTPTLVDKVKATRLTYRIRQGVATNGFPGAVSGWLPLAVYAVRNGATGFNQCDFYDVRPLAADRVRPQPIGAVGNEGLANFDANFDSDVNGQFTGFSLSEYGGYLAGGKLQRSAIPATLAQFGDATVTGGDFKQLSLDDSLSTYSAPATNLVYVAALFPRPVAVGERQLPRWARYCEAPDATLGRRVPNGTRGILAFTTLSPSDNGIFAPIPLPSACQLGVNGSGPVLGLTVTDGGLPLGSVGNRRRVITNAFFSAASIVTTGWQFIPTSGLGSGSVSWDLALGTHYPPGARGIVASFYFVTNNGSPLSAFSVFSSTIASPFPASSLFSPSNNPIQVTTTTPHWTQPQLIMRPTLRATAFPENAPSQQWRITVGGAGGVPAFTYVSAVIKILGWEF